MTDSQQLIADYAKTGSEAAFRELVTRYLGLVYATARRMTGGNDLLAEDVAQTVFADLARQAPTLPDSVMLGGWLHRHTCFVASKALRGEMRRQNREQEAVAMNALNEGTGLHLDRVAPVLDEAINQLGETDRQAIMLRFFEQNDLRAVGEALGASENAAQKRVARALAELRRLLQARGIASTTAALTALLASQAASAAPAGLALAISGAALGGVATLSAPTISTLQSLTMTKLQTSLLGVGLFAVVAGPLVLQQEIHGRRQAARETVLREQSAEVSRLAAENERLAKLLTGTNENPALPAGERGELLRLRAEVASLRELSKQTASARGPATEPGAKSPELKLDTTTEPLPSASWRFVGYATPEAAFQSMMWAMHHGEVKAYLDGLTEEARATAQAKWADKAAAELSERLKQEILGIDGIRLDRKRDVSETEVTFVVAVRDIDNGATRMRDESVVKFRKVGGEWKYTEAP